MFRFILSLFLILISFSAQSGVEEVRMRSCFFQTLFHQISRGVSVTTLRKELKVKATKQDADQFVQVIEETVGKENVELRDKPDDPGKVFITNTDYLVPFKGMNEKGAAVFSGKIRIRNYLVVPKNLKVKESNTIQNPEYSKIADGAPDEVFAKLEFKIGHPERGESGEWADLPGVVDKPGVVLRRKDIDLLLKNYGSFLQNREAIYSRGVAQSVNHPQELKIILDRIEEIYKYIHLGLLRSEGVRKQSNTPGGDGSDASRVMADSPLTQVVANIRYKRTARKIKFQTLSGKSFEAQVTIDDEVRVSDFTTKKTYSHDPGHRVVEFKIPTEYANLSDAELTLLGLSGLVKLRQSFELLQPVPGSKPGTGKLGHGLRQIREGDEFEGIGADIEAWD